MWHSDHTAAHKREQAICPHQHVHLQRYTDLEDHCHEQEQKAKSEQQQLRQQHKDELDDLRQQHDFESLRSERSYTREIQRLEASHVENVKNLNLRYRSLENMQKTEMHSLKQKHEADVQELKQACDRELEELRRNCVIEMRRKEDLHQEREAQTTKTYQARMEHLSQELRGANTALLARDADRPVLSLFKIAEVERSPDEQIKAQFAELVNQVDNLCRLAWKEGQQIWTVARLESFQKGLNLRMFRKALLQDRVWTILHNRILCSPFRVLGDEGQSIEAEWCKRYIPGRLILLMTV